MSAVDAVEAEVRELVRRRGLDPISDRLAMRRLVDEVVSHYDERSLTSALSPLVDSRQAARTVYDAVAGFGPLQRHLDDVEVEEIWINERLSAGSDVARQPNMSRSIQSCAEVDPAVRSAESGSPAHAGRQRSFFSRGDRG